MPTTTRPSQAASAAAVATVTVHNAGAASLLTDGVAHSPAVHGCVPLPPPATMPPMRRDGQSPAGDVSATVTCPSDSKRLRSCADDVGAGCGAGDADASARSATPTSAVSVASAGAPPPGPTGTVDHASNHAIGAGAGAGACEPAGDAYCSVAVAPVSFSNALATPATSVTLSPALSHGQSQTALLASSADMARAYTTPLPVPTKDVVLRKSSDAAPDSGKGVADSEEAIAAANLARYPVWLRFLPAMLVWPVWLFALSHGDGQFDEVFQYWPATVAMVLGSFIAGSTPLGGGVVAFPVSVLVLKFTSEESRDASALVQSIGMTSAGFLLFVTKPQLLHGHIMAVSCLGGVVGILAALELKTPPAIINFIYTVTVLLFGILYAYTNHITGITDKAMAKVQTPGGAAGGRKLVGPLGDGLLRDVVLNAALFASALVGGFITGNVGSGSDMLLYVFGIYVWNILCPNQRLSDTAFTASSVVVMGIMSVVCSAARGFTTGFSPKVVHCWGAMACIVCVGAPVGSMVLTPAAVPYLRALFYALAALQFAMFAGLKIQDNGGQWLVVGVLLAAELMFLATHKRWHAARLAKRVAAAADAANARRAAAARDEAGLRVVLDKAASSPSESVALAVDSSSTSASGSSGYDTAVTTAVAGTAGSQAVGTGAGAVCMVVGDSA